MKCLIKFLLVIALIVLMFQFCWGEEGKKYHSRNGFSHMNKTIVIPKGETRVGITNWGHTKNKDVVWVYDGPITDCYLNWVPLTRRLNGRTWRLEPLGTHKVYEIIDFDFRTGSITIRERI